MSSMASHSDILSTVSKSTVKGSKNSQSQSPSNNMPSQQQALRQSFESEDSTALHKIRASPSSPKHGIISALDKARRKLSSSSSSSTRGETLPSSEAEFERMKEKEMKKEQRKAEYERLKLSDKVKFGQGGMQMGG